MLAMVSLDYEGNETCERGPVDRENTIENNRRNYYTELGNKGLSRSKRIAQVPNEVLIEEHQA